MDFAAASLTMTYERKTAIEFSSPFYFETIGILIRYPSKPVSPFKLLLVFEPTVWIAIATSLTAVIFTLFGLGKVVTDKKTVAHCETFYECFWCVYRILTVQSEDGIQTLSRHVLTLV